MRHLFAFLAASALAIVTGVSCGSSGTAPTTGTLDGGATLDGTACTPTSCASAAAQCGLLGDGCGGANDCGTCATGKTCGSGATANRCVTAGCIAKTCASTGATCGPIADGCGAMLQCGTCATGQTCGGGGIASVCGTPACTPKTCVQLGDNCGPVGDGCGNQLDCGACVGGEMCGGGGTPSVCGTGTSCTPNTCAGQAVNCGPVGDGCGNVLQCGTCPTGQTCGGGGVASVCGAPVCVPKTCAGLGVDCGPVGDGCGGLLQCGTCSLPDTCGGGGMSSVCGISATCTNLCLQQVTCPNPAITTTVSGTVYAPNGTDPLPNALVYIPNAPVLAFTPGVSCDNCGASASGSPLVSTVTAVNGTFTLQNVPVGSNIPLVVQLGRWRRQVTIPSVASCTNTAVAATLTRLPSTKAEGDIPLMAFSTGAVDALECVMRKIGIADSEFTAPGGGGRINLYEGLTDPNSEAAGGAMLATSPTEDQLWTTQTALNQYDMVFFPCQSDQTTRAAAVQQNLINYANAGGRIFATHFSYVWLFDDAPFSGTAAWDVEQHPSPANQTGYIDQTFPKGALLAQWLVVVNASTTLGQIPLQVLRHDNDSIIAPSQSWMTINDVNFPGANVDYTFNTPVGAPATQQCGRVLFDDFHVENVGDSKGMIFPAECAAGTMTAQEKLLEFMIFDLSSCVVPDTPPACVPTTCALQGVGCGPSGDGCGGTLQCGTCPSGQTCGGGGTPSQCGSPSCTPETCAAQNIQCGPAGDGCGNEIACGACPQGQTCGGGGMPGVCGSQACTPETCAAQNIQCGPAGDGCGALLQCGSCPTGQTCGGGGTPGVCGSETCVPRTCAQLGFNCGPAADGCGNVLQCGTCQVPQTCGGGGTPSVCGGNGPR
jgi:hypothetical protein